MHNSPSINSSWRISFFRFTKAMSKRSASFSKFPEHTDLKLFIIRHFVFYTHQISFLAFLWLFHKPQGNILLLLLLELYSDQHWRSTAYPKPSIALSAFPHRHCLSYNDLHSAVALSMQAMKAVKYVCLFPEKVGLLTLFNCNCFLGSASL